MANHRKDPPKKRVPQTNVENEGSDADSLHSNLYEIERLGIKFHIPTGMRVESVVKDTSSLSLTLCSPGITLNLDVAIGYLGNESFERYHKRCLWGSSRDESSVVYHFSKNKRFDISGRSKQPYSPLELIYYMKFVRDTLYSPYYKKNCEVDARVLLEYDPQYQSKAEEIIKYFAAFPYDCADVPDRIAQEELGRIEEMSSKIKEYLKKYPTVADENSAAEEALDKEIDKAVESLDTTRLSFYHSGRFGLSLRVPRFMQLDDEQSMNNDGMKFHWNGDAIQLSFAGMFYDTYDEEDPWEEDKIWHKRYKQSLRWRSDKGCSVSYKCFKDNWYVISGKLPNGRIYYSKRVRDSLYSYSYGKINEVDAGVYLEYDPKYQSKAEEIIKYFATFPHK